ncbi:MAG: FAD-binding protein [Hamadaea sp.]|uniref:FAD-binding oxidoreductase n=1 Tax=Hamadaea sp. TaxID=2024425 RepID=UPI0017E75E64|nr:FAD-dependent oxidoreductase [Hamadaea sp.]NUT21479.1 FAD-binding protein [Hamadaea sp.]
MNRIATIARQSTLDGLSRADRTSGGSPERLPGLSGAVHLPGTEAYEELRKPLRADLDPRPAVVVEAATAADIRATLLAARRAGVPLAVQATGHGTHVAADDAVLLRTTNMTSVLVDPARRIARVGPGARWGQVLAAAAPFGLAPLSGSSPTVGVTGYTLGGGVGWLARKHGFAADSVVRAQVLTADGRLLTTGPDQYPDLFWALRGGGGGFGIVTSLEFQLYPVDQVTAGFLYVPLSGEAVAAYETWTATLPDDMSTALVVRRMPATDDVPANLRDRSVIMLKVLHSGDTGQTRALLAPMLAAAGPVLHDELGVLPYAQAAMGGTAARHLDFFPALPTGAITELLADHAATGSTVEIRHWGGAMAQPGPGAGPAGHRAAPFSVILDTPQPDTASRLSAYGTGATFLNFLADTGRTPTAFDPENLRRLRDVKRFYDPDDFFALGHTVTAPPRHHRLAA